MLRAVVRQFLTSEMVPVGGMRRLVSAQPVDVVGSMANGDLKIPPKKRSYEEAIVALNRLQSNAEAIRKATNRCDSDEKLDDVRRALRLIRVGPDELNRLNAIHVAGTKGKGSTCAFIEQILRDSGKKTGMFTSPHLVYVNERIKINGRPISRESFARHFWEVHDELESKLDGPLNMPAYFRMLTVLAFKVFLSEKVDVSIVEVGIGGRYDCTNVFPSPRVCVITTLDYDHVKILGNTLTQIAWQKAGIMKAGVPCVVADQTEEAMKVIEKEAEIVGCPLLVAPPLEEYSSPSEPLELSLRGDVQKTNASVAVQAAHMWRRRMEQSRDGLRGSDWKSVLTIGPSTAKSLQSCWLPGRAQIVKHDGVTYCVDGAHTKASMDACVTWFRDLVTSGSSDRIAKVLVFNCTMDREPEKLLKPLADLEWDAVYFSPNQTNCRGSVVADMVNCRSSEKEMLEKNERQRAAWLTLVTSSTNAVNGHGRGLGEGRRVEVVRCISEALDEAKKLAPVMKDVYVLVTGSMHLVGGVLSIIDPSVTGGE